VPFVEPVTTFSIHARIWMYNRRQHQKQNALPAAEVDRLLAVRKIVLKNRRARAAAGAPLDEQPAAAPAPPSGQMRAPKAHLGPHR